MTQIMSRFQQAEPAAEFSLGWSSAKRRATPGRSSDKSRAREGGRQMMGRNRISVAHFVCLIIESDGFLGLRGATRGLAVLHPRL